MGELQAIFNSAKPFVAKDTNNHLINTLADFHKQCIQLGIIGLKHIQQSGEKFQHNNQKAAANERNSAFLEFSAAGSAAATMIVAGFQSEGAGKSFLNAVTQLSQSTASAGKTFLGSRTAQFNAAQNEAMQIDHQQFSDLARECFQAAQQIDRFAESIIQKLNR